MMVNGPKTEGEHGCKRLIPRLGWGAEVHGDPTWRILLFMGNGRARDGLRSFFKNSIICRFTTGEPTNQYLPVRGIMKSRTRKYRQFISWVDHLLHRVPPVNLQPNMSLPSESSFVLGKWKSFLI